MWGFWCRIEARLLDTRITVTLTLHTALGQKRAGGIDIRGVGIHGHDHHFRLADDFECQFAIAASDIEAPAPTPLGQGSTTLRRRRRRCCLRAKPPWSEPVADASHRHQAVKSGLRDSIPFSITTTAV